MSRPPRVDEGPPTGPVRLTVVLIGAMGMATFPIFALAALGPRVVAELALTRTRLGAVSTTMFVTAVIGSLAIGHLVDRVGARRVLTGLFACSSAAVALLASANSFRRLLLAGIVAGLAQASANPSTNSVVAHHIAREHRGTVMGIKQAGVPMAQFVTGVIVAPVAVILGWRGAMLLGVVLAVPALAATLVLVPLATGFPGPGTARFSVVPRSLAWLFVCTFLLALVLQAFNLYLPLYAFEVVGASASTAGILVGVVGVVGMCARVLLGRLAGTASHPVRVVAIIGMVATLSAAAIALSAGGPLALLWLGAVAFGASVFGVNVVSMTVVVRSVDTADAGRATGALSTGMFAGFALGPIGFGSLVDRAGSYTPVWWLVTALCAAAACVALGAWYRTRPALARAEGVGA